MPRSVHPGSHPTPLRPQDSCDHVKKDEATSCASAVGLLPRIVTFNLPRAICSVSGVLGITPCQAKDASIICTNSSVGIFCPVPSRIENAFANTCNTLDTTDRGAPTEFRMMYDQSWGFFSIMEMIMRLGSCSMALAMEMPSLLIKCPAQMFFLGEQLAMPSKQNR